MLCQTAGVRLDPAARSILGRARLQPFVLVHRVAGDEQVPRDPVAKSVHRLLDVTGNIAADIHDRIPAACPHPVANVAPLPKGIGALNLSTVQPGSNLYMVCLRGRITR